MSERETHAIPPDLTREMRRHGDSLQPDAARGESRWLDHPQNVVKLYCALWMCGLVMVILDLVIHRHDPIALAETFGFYAAYGFIACVLLVLTAKGLRRLLMRPEDYYER